MRAGARSAMPEVDEIAAPDLDTRDRREVEVSVLVEAPQSKQDLVVASGENGLGDRSSVLPPDGFDRLEDDGHRVKGRGGIRLRLHP